MLNRLDDYAIHQTAEPVAHPASADVNHYDRTWCNGYTVDGDAYFALGLAVYPHRGIIDGSFSTVRDGARQHCFFASGRAPTERTDSRVGPFRIEVVEPMRALRVVLDDNDSPIACDLTFTAHTAPIEEVRQVLTGAGGARRFLDTTRFDQFGRWSGTFVDPDGECQVDADRWLGTKDRSWGVRPVGPQAPTAPGDLPHLFFLWAPLQWGDHVSHAIFFDDPDGRPLVREALTAPVLDPTADASTIADAATVQHDRWATVAHDLTYRAGTRWAEAAKLDMVGHDGARRRIELTPTLRFQMKGIGYTHPVWGHGNWHGELATHHETYDLADLDPTSLDNFHIQHVVTATDDAGRTGIGVLEQLAIGAHPATGLHGFLDPYQP